MNWVKVTQLIKDRDEEKTQGLLLPDQWLLRNYLYGILLDAFFENKGLKSGMEQDFIQVLG